MKLHSEAQVLEGTRLAILNTEKYVERQKQMAGYGFTLKRIQEGKGLLNHAELLQNVKKEHHSERLTISQKLKTDQQAAKALFKKHIVVTRAAFQSDPAVLNHLNIQRIAKGVWEWPRQALYFYTKAEEHVAQLEPFGINQEVIAQSKASIQALLDMKAERIDRKGLAEDSTQEKRKAFKALKAWLVEFRIVARLAFKDNPQVLESFGIVVSSKV